jgi:hypothetical protein
MYIGCMYIGILVPICVLCTYPCVPQKKRSEKEKNWYKEWECKSKGESYIVRERNGRGAVNEREIERELNQSECVCVCVEVGNKMWASERETMKKSSECTYVTIAVQCTRDEMIIIEISLVWFQVWSKLNQITKTHMRSFPVAKSMYICIAFAVWRKSKLCTYVPTYTGSKLAWFNFCLFA